METLLYKIWLADIALMKPATSSGSSDVFIKVALEQLDNAKEAKRMTQLREATKSAASKIPSPGLCRNWLHSSRLGSLQRPPSAVFDYSEDNFSAFPVGLSVKAACTSLHRYRLSGQIIFIQLLGETWWWRRTYWYWPWEFVQPWSFPYRRCSLHVANGNGYRQYLRLLFRRREYRRQSSASDYQGSLEIIVWESLIVK